jgi:type I restriction enzyme S subunit
VSDESLPPGWAVTELGDICAIHDSRRIPINATERNARIAGLRDSDLFPYYGATGEVGKIDGFLFDGEYVLIGEDGAPFLEPHRGVSYLVNGRFWVNNHAHILEHPTSNRFLCHYLRQIDYRPFVTGTTRLKLNQAQLRRIPVPLPPLAEQKRIVAKIEELFSELEAGEESLRVARRQLGVYRQSLLKQAFEGKLTEKWRTQNPARLESWSWLTLQDIADVTGGLTKNSKRDSLPTRIPYLRVANVYANELRLDEIKDIGVTPEEAKKVRLAKGDLLIVEGNGSLDQIGRVALWDGSIPDCGHQNHLIRARCHATATPAFVLMFLLSPRGRELIEKQAASTSGLHTLSVSKVQRLPVPLCSLPEQQEIVRLLDAQFEVIEQNEREIDAALQRSEALRQAILKKAFTGRLVPQNPSDEPASQLLARLRAEGTMTPSKRKPVLSP